MLAVRDRLETADVEHWQWTTMPRLDRRLIGKRDPNRPRVITLHYPLPKPGETRKLEAQRRYLDTLRRRRRPHRDGRDPAPRRGRARSGEGRGDPARTVRLPDQPRLSGVAADRADRGEGAGDPLLRAAPPLQGNRHPARGVRLRRGRRAVDRRNAADVARAAAEARRQGAGPGPHPAPLHPRPRDPGADAQGGHPRPSLPRDRAVRGALHRPRLRASRWCSGTSAASPSSPANTTPPGSSRPATRRPWRRP